MSTAEMERRLVDLESAFSERIARLEEQVARLSGQEAVPVEGAWWKRILGVFQDDPEFEAAMQLGRAYRESLRPHEESPPGENG